MINRVQVKNFKALRDVSLELTPIHALIGPNDSGKSSILQALFAIVHSAGYPAEACFPGLWNGVDLVWGRNPDALVEVSVDVDINDKSSTYSVGWSFIEHERAVQVATEQIDEISLLPKHPLPQTFVYRSESKSPLPFPEGMNADLIYDLRKKLNGVHFYRFEPQYLHLPAASDSRWRMRMHPTGFGLPQCLDDILGEDRSQFDKLEQEFKQVFPEFSGIKLVRQPAYESQPLPHIEIPKFNQREGKGIFFKLANGNGQLPAAQASDGVLLVLAYLAILYLPSPPSLLLIEEPENGIHPERLKDIVRILKRLVDRQQQTQIVLTTHSPYLLDEFEPHEVTLCQKDDEGAIQTRRLSSIPSVNGQIDVFRLGEIWTGEGDEALAKESGDN